MEEQRLSTGDFSSQIGARIRAARIAGGMSQLELSRRVKIGRSAVAQWERGESTPSLAKIEEIAGILQLEPAFLAFGAGSGVNEVGERTPQFAGLVRLQEYDFATASDPERAGVSWGVQMSWLRDEIEVQQTEDVVIHPCAQTELRYQLGDRLIVDRANLKPSPPGDFLYWDGLGPRVGRLSLVPSKSQDSFRIRIMDDTGTYEVADDEIRVFGRIRGYFRAVR